MRALPRINWNRAISFFYPFFFFGFAVLAEDRVIKTWSPETLEYRSIDGLHIQDENNFHEPCWHLRGRTEICCWCGTRREAPHGLYLD